MAKLLALDLDGTLFYPKQIKRCIPKKNIKFLRKWIDAGNKVVLVSSRSHQFTEKLEKEIQRPVDYINCTSSQIYHDGKLIRDVYMPKQDFPETIKKIDEKYKPIGYLMTSKNYPLIIRDNHRISSFFLYLYKIYWLFQFSCREPYILDNDVFDKELKEGEIYKMMIFFGIGKNKNKVCKEINKELREHFPDIESSWVGIVNEITPTNCNKGAGLEFYCNALKINPNDVYVVGDSGNDITMFTKFHEHSFCMAHAYPSVKKYAKYVISRVFKLEKHVLKGE